MIEIKRREPEEIIKILSEKLMLCMAKSMERKKVLEEITSVGNDGFCLLCGGDIYYLKEEGHKQDCKYKKALEDVE